MQILAAYDLTQSYRDAGELAGCSHHTVEHYVSRRASGDLSAEPARRSQIIDDYLDKIEEWVEASHGKVRADVAHDKLVAMGYQASERTTRRAGARVKASWAAGTRRIFRPWIPEPGMWFQYDFGDGPMIAGRPTTLFCAWLAWCRFRVVLAILDKTLPTVIACIDTSLRRFGGCPTYALTDNEKTVTTEHVAGIAIRNQAMVAAGRHYGLTLKTCMPADPASKGGSESTVRVAKADLVPTDANLLPAYENFANLEAGCLSFCEQVNARPHRVTRRAPAEMLAEERTRLHPLPQHPYTVAFGVTRTVGTTTPMIGFETGSYSCPEAWPASRSGCAPTATTSSSFTWARTARRRWPGTCAPRPATPGWTRPTSLPEQATPCSAPPGGAPPGSWRSWHWVPEPPSGSWLPARPGSAGSGPRWPRRWTWPRSLARNGWTGHWATPPSWDASPKVTWRPSSTTWPAPTTGRRRPPRTTACSPVRPPGRCSADDHPHRRTGPAR